jgi:hypothetical protein
MNLKLIIAVCFILCMALWALGLAGAVAVGTSGWVPFFAVFFLAALLIVPGGPAA